jgi:hypothetical protein
MNGFIYVISVATCKPNLYVCIFDSEVILLAHFIIIKNVRLHKKCCVTLAAKSFNILEIVLPRPQVPSATIFLSVR